MQGQIKWLIKYFTKCLFFLHYSSYKITRLLLGFVPKKKNIKITQIFCCTRNAFLINFYQSFLRRNEAYYQTKQFIIIRKHKDLLYGKTIKRDVENEKNSYQITDNISN